MKKLIVAAVLALSTISSVAAISTPAHADFWSEKTKDGI